MRRKRSTPLRGKRGLTAGWGENEGKEEPYLSDEDNPRKDGEI